jgi:hypothetical protein
VGKRRHIHAVKVPNAPPLWAWGGKPNHALQKVLYTSSPAAFSLPLCEDVIFAKT